MKTLRNILIGGTAALVMGASAQAHTVALGWDVLPNGDVKFYDGHWHNDQAAPSQFLTIDGINYNFTGVQNNTPILTGLDGALVNTTFYTFASGTLTALGTIGGYGAVNGDYLTVIVSGLTTGQHTFTASTDILTDWNIPSNNGSFVFTLPPPPPSVPDGGSTMALLGLAFTAVAGARRKFGI